MEWNEETRVLIRWTTTEVTTYSATLELSQVFDDQLTNALAALSEGRELHKVIEEYEALGEQENSGRIIDNEFLGDREIDSATLEPYVTQLVTTATCEHRPDDLPEPGDRCKYCGTDITWIGPGPYNWAPSTD